MHSCVEFQIFTDEPRDTTAGAADAQDAAAEPVHDAGTRRAAPAEPAAVSLSDQRGMFAASILPDVRRSM